MSSVLCAFELKEFLEVTSVVVAAIAFIAGVWQYHQAQVWKRAEFVAEVMKAFNSQESTYAVKLLFDWINPKVPLADENGKVESVRVTDEELKLALRIPKPGGDRFEQKEFALRGVFDEYFDTLERFGHYIQSGLVESKDLKPYLDYWLGLISGSRKAPAGLDKPAGYRDTIARYVAHYGWSGVILLFERSGYPLTLRV